MKINGYLTSGKLVEALKSVVDQHRWLGTELSATGVRGRWDAGFVQDGRRVYVEFDGPTHYTDALVIRRDRLKEAALRPDERVVRVPYWVQLTTKTASLFFGLSFDVEQDFPHGFIDKKAPLPASFCEAGIARFKKEILGLPLSIRAAVASSLAVWIDIYGIEYVVPKSLRNWFKRERRCRMAMTTESLFPDKPEGPQQIALSKSRAILEKAVDLFRDGWPPSLVLLLERTVIGRHAGDYGPGHSWASECLSMAVGELHDSQKENKAWETLWSAFSCHPRQHAAEIVVGLAREKRRAAKTLLKTEIVSVPGIALPGSAS